MREDIGRGAQRAQGALALEVALDEHARGQLGRVDLPLVDQAVAEVGDAVGRDAEVEVVGVGGYDRIGDEALLKENLTALAVGQGDIVGAVGVGINGDARLDDLRGGERTVALLEIVDVAGVVEVRVRADHAARVQAVFLEQIRQAAAVKLGIARVEEDNVAVVELIDGDEGGRRLSHIGFPVYMAQIHRCSCLSVVKWRGAENAAAARFFPLYSPRGKNTSAPARGPPEKNPEKIRLPPMQETENKVK